MAAIDADIREIRQTVYGRDMREPIADACEHIRKTAEKELLQRESETSRIERLSGSQLTAAAVENYYGDDWALIFTRREV